MLIAFKTSHTLHTKGHSGSVKTYSNFIRNFYFPHATILVKVLCNDCITCQLNKPYPNQKQIADFKGQVYILIIESHLIRKDQYHHPQKETHILWSLLTHLHTT